MNDIKSQSLPLRVMSVHERAARAPTIDSRRTQASRRKPKGADSEAPHIAWPDYEQSVIDAALAILRSRLMAPGIAMQSPEQTRQFLMLQLGDKATEQFGVLFLDAQHRLIAFDVLFKGTLTQTSIYPREVLFHALQHGAASVILAHNHPSGNCKPSPADYAITRLLKAALAMVDVRVLDHIIVGGSEARSMAEAGELGDEVRVSK